jgi:TonB family protein
VATSRWISPTATAINDAADFARAAGLWKQQAAARATETAVLVNAADFLGQPGGDLNEAERLLVAARGIEPQNLAFRNRLANLYADAAAGKLDRAFADRVKLQLQTSTDGMLLGWTGRMMVESRVPAAVELGKELIARAEQNGFPPAPVAKLIPSAVGSSPAPPAPILASTPALIDKVEPAYPALARQARIEGIVRLKLTVADDGKVQHIQVVMGHPLLVPPTLEAVKQWVYSPVPGGGTFQVDVPFTLPAREVASSANGFIKTWPKPEGVAGGVPGGVAGGVPGGIPGGVAGSTFRLVQQSEFAQAAKLISKVEPEYPALARQAGVAGSVVLEVTIGEDGKVQTVRNRSGHPLLTAAAITAVRQWAYSPTLIDNQPAVVMTIVTLNFQ